MLAAWPLEIVFKELTVAQMHDVLAEYRRMTCTPPRCGCNVSVPQLQEMVASRLVSVGAHTINHPILTNESDTSCTREIESSIADLSDLLAAPITSFAYPNGIVGLDCGVREAEVLRRQGIRLGFTTEARHLSRSDDPMQVPRIGVSDREPLASIHAKFVLGSAWPKLKLLARTGEVVRRKRLSRTLESYRRHARMPVAQVAE
jgi:hypothetical protein